MIRVFIDFDGTVSRQDVGDAMFERFGGVSSTEAVREYRAEKISATECFRRECTACGDVDRTHLDSFLDGQEIDPTFQAFLAFCRSRGMECAILSDGMDYYIRRILERNGIGDTRFFSNALELKPVTNDGTVRLVPSFPFTDETCDRCACCKRNHMLTLSGDEDVIVYVGEGYSDRCPSRYADVVFAKDDLLAYCRSEKLPCHEYGDFSDVQRTMETLLSGSGRRPLKKRRQAELARKEVTMGG